MDKKYQLDLSTWTMPKSKDLLSGSTSLSERLSKAMEDEMVDIQWYGSSGSLRPELDDFITVELSSSKQKEREKVSKYSSPMASPKTAKDRQVVIDANKELENSNSASRYVWNNDTNDWSLITGKEYRALLKREQEEEAVNEFGPVSP